MDDMKDGLERRYGRNFEEIYRKYTGKGWGDSGEGLVSPDKNN